MAPLDFESRSGGDTAKGASSLHSGPYRPDIDGLRAIAVLSVLVFHVVHSALPGGYLGVDIFFVISGYLISLILLREQGEGSFGFGAFYARRVRRLFPALAVTLFATLLFGAFALFPDEYERMGRHAFYAIVFMLNFRLMGEAGYFDVASNAKPLLHLWSLSVEEQFYLVWPIVLLAARRIRVNAGVAIGVCGVCSMAYGIHLAGRNPDALYFHPLARAWELLLGAALAYWHATRGVNALPSVLDSRLWRNVLSLGGLALIGFALFRLDETSLHPGPAVLAPLVGVAAIIATGSDTVVGRALAFRPLVWIGLISYPLYLWHWPLLSFVHIMESGEPAEWMLWVAAFLAVLLAWATYALVERPLRYGLGRRNALRVLIGSMCLLLVGSRVVVAGDGLPNRPSVRYAKEAEAQAKREQRQDESCLGLFKNGEAPVYCRQSMPGKRMVAIIGDSHAHVLFPGVSELAGKRGYGTLLLANSGCPPFTGAVTGRNDRERAECARNIETILNALEKDERIDAVVIASRGPQYLDGSGFGPAEAGENYPPIAGWSQRGVLTDRSSEEAFIGGLQATIERLSSRIPRIAYLLQVPELGVPPLDCLDRPLSLSRARNRCEVPLGKYESRMARYRALIEGLHASIPSLVVVDPQSIFCTETHCRGLRGRELLYADDDHLSVLGSRLVAPLILGRMGP